jgi:hypothetical protein
MITSPGSACEPVTGRAVGPGVASDEADGSLDATAVDADGATLVVV